MRHIIVIETVDPEAGGELLSPQLESVLLRTVEIGVTEAHGVCYVDGRFNVKSAVAAVREMYGAGN